MINNTAYSDVKASSILIGNAGIITTEQLNAFLKKRGLNNKRIESVKKILVKEKYAYVDDSNTYYSASPMITYSKYTDELKKAIWLFIDSVPDMNYINFKCKIPCIAYICNDKTIRENNVNDFTIFCIRRGTESISSRIINTNFGDESCDINSIIIIDEPSQIEEIKLEKPIKIIAFAIISNDGKVQYYNE